MIDTLNDANDSAVRNREGWDLFECSDSEHAPYELERVDFAEDDCDQLEGDEDAVRLVVSRAAGGSAVHVRALAFLALCSPEDLFGIANWLFFGEYRTHLRPRNTR